MRFIIHNNEQGGHTAYMVDRQGGSVIPVSVTVPKICLLGNDEVMLAVGTLALVSKDGAEVSATEEEFLETVQSVNARVVLRTSRIATATSTVKWWEDGRIEPKRLALVVNEFCQDGWWSDSRHEDSVPVGQS